MKKLHAVIISILIICSFSVTTLAASFYVVQPGDMLWQVAKKFNTTYQEIAKANNLKDPNLIVVGQKLTIPEAVSAVPAVAPAKPATPATPTGVQPGAPVAPAGPAGLPPSKVHKEKFSVITVGSGNPIINQNRASACTVVQFNGKYYVLDTGDGAAKNFDKFKMQLRDINAILFTHLHLDHTSNYPEVMVNRWMQTGKEMKLIGPPRTEDLQKNLLTFYADDLVYRMYKEAAGARGIKEIGMITGIEVKEYTGKNTFELDGMKVSTAELVHTQYNLGYRFDVNGKSIVVSGDTDYSTNLVELAKGADVLVLDVSTLPAAQNPPAAVVEDPTKKKPEPKYEFSGNFDVIPHMNIAKAAKTAVEANPKKVVITHSTPAPLAMEQIVAVFQKAGYKGEVIEAVDGLEINP